MRTSSVEEKGRSPVWIRWCLVSAKGLANIFPQCSCRARLNLKLLWHCGQECGRSSPCVLSCLMSSPSDRKHFPSSHSAGTGTDAHRCASPGVSGARTPETKNT
uniref:Uncharacterized protein n=1 Tax=Cyprinus carpio carpio TaxID=630221 RepID=A0A9J8C3Q0_CYPCA